MEALFLPDPEDDGGGKYDVIKLWEIQLMMELSGGNEDSYGLIPVLDRARFICAKRLSDWVSALDMREMRSNARNNPPESQSQGHSQPGQGSGNFTGQPGATEG